MTHAQAMATHRPYPHTGDPAIYIIHHNHHWYVEDGHHRLRAAIERGEHHIQCRIWPPTQGTP